MPRPIRLELSIEFDLDAPEKLDAILPELESALPAEKWEALVQLSKSVARRSDSVAVHLRIPE